MIKYVISALPQSDINTLSGIHNCIYGFSHTSEKGEKIFVLYSNHDVSRKLNSIGTIIEYYSVISDISEEEAWERIKNLEE